MPFTFVILVGLLAAVAGAILFLGTRYKKAALVVAVLGVAMLLLGLGVIVLVANSDM